MKQRWQIIGVAVVVIISGAIGYYSNNRPEASGIGDVNQFLPDPITIRYAHLVDPFGTDGDAKNFDTFTMKSRRSDYSYRWHVVSFSGTNVRLVENCSPTATDSVAPGKNVNSVRQFSQGLAQLKPIDIPDYVFIRGFDAKTQQYISVTGSTPLEGGKGYFITSRDPITCLTFASEDEIAPSSPIIRLEKGWNLVGVPLSLSATDLKVGGIFDPAKVEPASDYNRYNNQLRTTLVRQAPYFKSSSDLLAQPNQTHLPSILDSDNKSLFYSQMYSYRDKDGWKTNDFYALTTKAFPCKNDCWEPAQATFVYAFNKVDLAFDGVGIDPSKNPTPFTGDFNTSHTDSFDTDQSTTQ